MLTPFFYHDDKNVIAAALEVYVRRAYRAYIMHDIVHHVHSDLIQKGVHFMDFRFRFPEKAADDQQLTAMHQRSYSVSDALFNMNKAGGSSTKEIWRVGLMVSVPSLAHLRDSFSQLIERIPFREPDQDLPEDQQPHELTEPSDVVNIALQMDSDAENKKDEDQKVLKKLSAFVDEVKALLRGRWVRRITFMIPRKAALPAYFTFRERLDYAEDPVIR